MGRSQTEDPGRFWTGEVTAPVIRSTGPCCIIRVQRFAKSVDVIGEAYLSEDLPSLIWTIESIPVTGRGEREAAHEANSAAHRHASRMPRVRVIAVHDLDLDALS